MTIIFPGERIKLHKISLIKINLLEKKVFEFYKFIFPKLLVSLHILEGLINY